VRYPQGVNSVKIEQGTRSTSLVFKTVALKQRAYHVRDIEGSEDGRCLRSAALAHVQKA
jgi:hypothetical protein